MPLLAVLLAGGSRQLERQATAILFNLSGCSEMVPCMKEAEVPKPFIKVIPARWRTHFPVPSETGEVAANAFEGTSAEEEPDDPAHASSLA